jgi:hypothetical protein
MKKLFAALAVLALCAVASQAAYNGTDTGSYKGSKCIHFSVAVTSQTTAATFAVASYSSSFSTLDDMEFVVAGSSPVFVSDTTAFVTGTAAAPTATVRYMALGEKYRLDGRNVDSIFIKCQDGTSNSAVITGTIWGH